MKAVKITLTTYLTYYDEKEQLEVELEDEMAAQLEAFANGGKVTNVELQECLPDIYEEIDYEAFNRAHDILVIDGYKNYSECCVVNEAKLHEMYEVSDFEGGYEDWLEEEKARVSQMDTAEYAEYLEEIYGIECEMVEESYTFSYTPES
jgi:hypothetical protein